MTRRRYEAYRDSGVEWLGDVPAHWGVKRLKFSATYQTSSVDKKTEDGELPVRLCNYTDVYYGDRIRAGDGEFMEATATEAEVERFRLRVGDVLITKDSEDWRDIAVPALIEETAADFVCGYHLGIFRGDHQLHAPYLFRVLQSGAVNQQFQVASTGVTRYGMPNAAAGNAIVPLPPIEEQRAIAAFLDRETAKVDALIEKKRLLIERLEEQRIALISRTVTRGLPTEAARAAGLDPSPRLKPSGVEWLGEVPEHWDVVSLRRLTTRIDQGKSPVADERPADESEWAILKLSAVKKGRFHPAEHKALGEDAQPDRRYEVCRGDFLLTRSNTPELVGDVCVVDETRWRLLLPDLIYRLRLSDAVVGPFLSCFLLSRPGRTQISREAHGSSGSMVKVSQDRIRRWMIPLPPLAEQFAISRYLDELGERIHHLSERHVNAIERLQEYRTALITAAVTGKIDVRDSVLEEVAAG